MSGRCGAVGRARYVSLRYNLEDSERVGALVRGGLVGAGEELWGIGGPDYYGTVYPASEAAGTRTTRPTTRGSAATRAGVEPVGTSFFANLRRSQVSTLERPVG
jgi:hypothetical protein